MRHKIFVLVAVLFLFARLSLGATKGKQVEFLLSGLVANGQMLSLGKVYTYAAGTTSAKSLYTDAEMTEIASNPLTLDLNGRYVAYGDGLYKFVVKNSIDTTIFTADDVDLTSVEDFSTGNVSPFGVTLYQRNIISSSVVSLAATVGSFTVTGYVNVTGPSTWNNASITSLIATLGADLDANNHKIKNLAAGTAIGDAVNLGQLNTLGSGLSGCQLFSSVGASNFTVPAGISRILVTCVGGGGGGGGSASSAAALACGGSGGSGAAVYRFEVASASVVLAGAVWTITIGGGGSGGVGGIMGTMGGTSSVYRGADLIVSCTGGTGGESAFDGAVGGDAGVATVIDSAAKITNGHFGGPGRHYSLSTTLYVARSSSGGSNIFGVGDRGGIFFYNPTSYAAGLHIDGVGGSGYGAGGSGSVSYRSTASGGPGTNGFVLLEW